MIAVVKWLMRFIIWTVINLLIVGAILELAHAGIMKTGTMSIIVLAMSIGYSLIGSAFHAPGTLHQIKIRLRMIIPILSPLILMWLINMTILIANVALGVFNVSPIGNINIGGILIDLSVVSCNSPNVSIFIYAIFTIAMIVYNAIEIECSHLRYKYYECEEDVGW